MPAKREPSDAVLAEAAELRAAGSGWDAVARKVGRSADAARRWPALYPDRWAAALRDAERRLLAEAGAESVLILRQLLRSEDEKIRRDAARFLIDLRIELARLEQKATDAGAKAADDDGDAPDPDARRLTAFLKEHSDADVDRLVAELLARPGRGVPARPPGRAGGA